MGGSNFCQQHTTQHTLQIATSSCWHTVRDAQAICYGCMMWLQQVQHAMGMVWAVNAGAVALCTLHFAHQCVLCCKPI
jgi:hypothetical protein